MNMWTDVFIATLCGASQRSNVPQDVVYFAEKCADLAEDIHMERVNRSLKKARECLREEYPKDVV